MGLIDFILRIQTAHHSARRENAKWKNSRPEYFSRLIEEEREGKYIYKRSESTRKDPIYNFSPPKLPNWLHSHFRPQWIPFVAKSEVKDPRHFVPREFSILGSPPTRTKLKLDPRCLRIYLSIDTTYNELVI